MKPRVSVIVVNYNGKGYLEGCLISLAKQTYPNYEIVLVDNASSDGSIEWAARHLPQAKILRNPHNLGFAAANNQAIASTQSEFVALLNNDVEVEPTWLEELTRGAELSPCIGMCASKILFYHHRDRIDSAGIEVDLAGIAWNRANGARDEGGQEVQEEVFGSSAAAALYRRVMLEEIGLFDTDFFAYLEDADLAWRARLAGWRCIYVPRARVYHHHSASAGQLNPSKGFLLGRNKVWCIAKNYPTLPLLLLWPLILFYDLLSLLYSLSRGDLDPLRGRMEGVRKLGIALAKRDRIQRRAHVWRLAAPKSLFYLFKRQRRLEILLNQAGKAMAKAEAAL